MKELDFFYELTSPYSYLAATQMPALIARTGAKVRFRPMLLGAVFQQTGNVMPGANPVKARYMIKDLARWAAAYGVPLRFPSRFPLSTVKALRLCVQAEETALQQELALRLFHAAWADDADINDDAVLRPLLTEIGLPADELLEGCQAPAVKDALRATTDEAVRRGVFGAPSFFVGDELFFGNDRLPFVMDALRG